MCVDEITIDEVETLAHEATGLSDFGPSHYRDGLDVSLESLVVDGPMHEEGVRIMRDLLVLRLSTRLKWTEWIAKHPEINTNELSKPLLDETRQAKNKWPPSAQRPSLLRHQKGRAALAPAMPLRFLAICFVVAISASRCATAQTLPSGVFNAPPTVIGNRQSIGSDTTVNVLENGFVGHSFNAGLADGSSTNVVVNISGGMVGSRFGANSGSTVNISGGKMGSQFNANPGSVVNISGGTVGWYFNANSGSTVEFLGGEFLLNGAPYSGTSLTLGPGDVFTGAFADGSPFLFSNSDDRFSYSFDTLQEVTLVPTPLPPIDLSPQVVDGANPTAPAGLRAGQMLTLRDGGTLGDDFAVLDATLHIEGGTVRYGVEAARSTVNISGGTVGGGFFSGSIVNISGGTVEGDYIDARSGSTVNISGGTVGVFSANSGSTVNISGGTVGGGEFSTIPANSGSTVNVSGGTVASTFSANSGSTVNISGGAFGLGTTLGGSFIANSGSTVNISGGTVGSFQARSGSMVEFHGGEFQLNGAPYSDTSLTLDSGDVFTGTFADGSSFLFSNGAFWVETLQGVTLVATPLPPIDLSPRVVDGANPTAPTGLRAGQMLTLRDGGTLGENFAVIDATLYIEGGSVVSGMEVARAMVNISGGTVGSDFNAHSGSTVNISGGTVGRHFNAHSGSTVNISGGTVGSRFNAHSGSTVNISGGTVGSNFYAYSGSTVSIIGGTVGNIYASSGSTVNISGSEFFLDGMPLALEPGLTTTINNRNVLLSGLLADGTAFELNLNSNFVWGQHLFEPGATLTVTLVPEPSTALLGIGLLLVLRRVKRAAAA